MENSETQTKMKKKYRNYGLSYPEGEQRALAELNKLMNEWRGAIPDAKRDFVPDGFYPYYYSQPIRVLFLGMESPGYCTEKTKRMPRYLEYSYGEYHRGTYDTTTLRASAFHRRLFCIMHAVLHGDAKELGEINVAELAKDFATEGHLSFAYMILNKASDSGKVARTRWKKLRAFIDNYHDRIFREIEILDPDVIITEDLFFNPQVRISMVNVFPAFKTVEENDRGVDIYFTVLNSRLVFILNTHRPTAEQSEYSCFYESVRDACKMFDINGRAPSPCVKNPEQEKLDRELRVTVEDEHCTAERVRELLAAGADVNCIPAPGEDEPIAAIAAEHGRLDIVKLLMDAGADVNAKGHFFTPLIAAALSGNTDVAAALLQAGADVSTVTGEYTVLTAAAVSGNNEMVKMMLRAGADLYAREGPLSCYDESWIVEPSLIPATISGDTELVQILLDAGADVNMQAHDRTPLTVAAARGHIAVVKQLLQAGADVNPHVVKHVPVALHVALRRGDKKLVRLLLDAGTKMQYRTATLYSPLHAAIEGEHFEIVKLLIEVGADLDAEVRGESPLQAAFHTHNRPIVALLQKAGAKGPLLKVQTFKNIRYTR